MSVQPRKSASISALDSEQLARALKLRSTEDSNVYYCARVVKEEHDLAVPYNSECEDSDDEVYDGLVNTKQLIPEATLSEDKTAGDSAGNKANDF